MKTILLCNFFSIFVFPMWADSPKMGENLIKNPGFEDVNKTDGWAESWDIRSQKNGGRAKLFMSDYESHSGSHCLLLDQTKEVVSGQEGFCLVSQGRKTLPVQPGKKYLLRFWYKAEGLKKEQKDPGPGHGYACLVALIFWNDENGKCINTKMQKNSRENFFIDVDDWGEVVGLTGACGVATGFRQPETAPANAVTASIRFQLMTTAEWYAPKVWIDDVGFFEISNECSKSIQSDNLLKNPSFEKSQIKNSSLPLNWEKPLRGKYLRSKDVAYKGKYSVMISETPMGLLSAWTQRVKVRYGEVYCCKGMLKTENVNPGGAPRGACIFIRFFRKNGLENFPCLYSRAFGGYTDWTEVEIEEFEIPHGTTEIEVGAGMRHSSGKAWFDDLVLTRR